MLLTSSHELTYPGRDRAEGEEMSRNRTLQPFVNPHMLSSRMTQHTESKPI
jgi:hypothetical protein